MKKSGHSKSYRLSGLLILIAIFLHLVVPLQCVTGFSNNSTNKKGIQNTINGSTPNFSQKNLKKIDACCIDANLFTVYQETSNYSFTANKIGIAYNFLCPHTHYRPKKKASQIFKREIHFLGDSASKPIYLINATFLNWEILINPQNIFSRIYHFKKQYYEFIT